MHIKKLTIYENENDRTNYSQLVDLKKIVFLTGINGAGKTQFLYHLGQRILTKDHSMNVEFTTGIDTEQMYWITKLPDPSPHSKNTLSHGYPSEFIQSKEEEFLFLKIPTMMQTNIKLEVHDSALNSAWRSQTSSNGEHNVKILGRLIGTAIEHYRRDVVSIVENSNINSPEIREMHKHPINRINEALKFIFPYLKIKKPSADSVAANEEIKLVINDNIRSPIDLKDLSSGEYVMLVLAVEILSRNIASGIILIDELDAHLHSELQIKTIPFLLSLLGEKSDQIQLWITTHSPEIIDPHMLAPYEYSIVHVYRENHRISLQNLTTSILDKRTEFLRILGSTHYYGRKPILLLEGSTDKPIMEAFLARISLQGVFVLHPMGNCKAVIDNMIAIQKLMDVQMHEYIPELDLLHGIVDEDDERTESRIKKSQCEPSIFIWPFYHIENLLFQEPWYSIYATSLATSSSINLEDIHNAFNIAAEKYIEYQEKKTVGDSGRYLSDKTLEHIKISKDEYRTKIPGRSLLKFWLNERKIRITGGIKATDIILKLLKSSDHEFPEILKSLEQNLRNYISHSVS